MKTYLIGSKAIVSAILALVLSSAIFYAREREARSQQAPAGSGYHAMVYDPAAERIILFGGQTGDIFSQSSETWEYDPAQKTWGLMHPREHPPALTAHALAYDARSGRTVLYGGVIITKEKEARLFHQTWIFNYGERNWTRASDGPPERYGHRMAGVADSGVIVLFGGARVDAATKNNALKLGDTWTYEASSDRWREMRPSVSPSPRHYFGMVYDTKASRIIVWGGAKEGSPDESSVWVYDPRANAWTERKPAAGPSPRSYVAMAYDSRADKAIVYGGNPEGLDETWIYDYETNTWAERRPERNPGKLSRMPIVYAPGIGRTVLFGGQLDKRQFAYSDQTWFYGYSDNIWENVTAHKGEERRAQFDLRLPPDSASATDGLWPKAEHRSK